MNIFLILFLHFLNIHLIYNIIYNIVYTHIYTYYIPHPHVCKCGEQNIRNHSQYDAVQINTTANYNLKKQLNDDLSNGVNQNIFIFVKVEFMAELLYCIALDFAGVPN